MSKAMFAAALAATLFFEMPTGSALPLRLPEITPLAPNEISVLTYNVQDLPWPIVADRSNDLATIGMRLAELRRRGAAPQLVVLQEAFSEESRLMLRAAGYEHIAVGPRAEEPRAAPPEPLDAKFIAARSVRLGEAQAPRLSSGLMIASDYPILSVASAPFPRDACAGVDCLANKGVMLARIAVPGLPRPLELVTTHLNAGNKSMTPPARHLYAWSRQLDAIERFLDRHGDASAPRLFAGDVNVCNSAKRLARLEQKIARWGMRPVTAMGKPRYAAGCKGGACAGLLPIASNVPLIDTLDWHATRGSRDVTFTPLARDILFGPEADGSMLSDHIGYAVRYRVDATRMQNARRSILRRAPGFPLQEDLLRTAIL